MPILKVLINNKGEVVGTARTDRAGSGTGAPQSATMVARPDQRLIEVAVEDKVASLDPAALHATIKMNFLK
jgi:ribosomal protein L16/L10AE